MEGIKKYQAVIEAIQFQDDVDTIANISEFIQDDFSVDYSNKNSPTLKIPTIEGTMTAMVGDYIIKGVHGGFYICKPDVFKETYIEV